MHSLLINWREAMPNIKHLSVLALATAAAGACLAQDVGRVISTQPVVQQISVPQRVCTNQQVEVQQQKSGAGAVMGAIAGGAIGNQVGRGAGNAAATMIGIMGGAILGDRVEGAPPTQLQTVQNCTVQNTLENRTIGYNVVYEFGGKQYAVRMPNDPGPTISLQVSPVGAQPQDQVSAAPQAYQPPEYVQNAPVVYTQQTIVQPYYVQPVYAQPVYGPRYYPPVSLNLGFGYWGGGGHHHGHWR
jgi:uncharacterized protein YcfJ